MTPAHNPAPHDHGRGVVRYDAGAAFDALGCVAAPASLLVRTEDGHACPEAPGAVAGRLFLLASGTPGEVDHHPEARAARRIAMPGSVLVPGMVNAHTHLDLTHLGPLPHDPTEGFVAWVDRVRTGRLHDDEAIAVSVRRGVALCLAGGTVAVGDIAGAPGGRPTIAPLRALRDGPVRGVCFVEFFAAGALRDRALGRLAAFLEANADDLGAGGALRAGLQPHAPNTVEPAAYEQAIALAERYGLPMATHLAETPEERALIERAQGPQRELLEQVGAWEDRLLGVYGRGLHPIDHLGPVLDAAPFLVAHVNDCPDEARLERLARTGASVAYCPRASAYFDAPAHFGPHRYREMLDAGINVCLGTDSLINLPGEAADHQRGGMSVLDEVRLLMQRDGADAHTLLGMATVNGARALGIDESAFLLRAGGRLAGLVSLEAEGGIAEGSPTLEAAILSGFPPRLLLIGK